MRRLLEAYPYVAPALLTPLAAWLWWRHYHGDAGLGAIALFVPIVHAYVVPGVGTNVLGVWELETRLRLGRFRPHHGFVFGSATAMLVLPVAGEPFAGLASAELWRRGLVAAALVGGVNWLYDVAAIRAGILKVYNQPWADGRGPAAIVSDYAPWFFGGFGLLYGAGLAVVESVLGPGAGARSALAAGAALVAATITLPTLGYAVQSYLRHGHHGCRPVRRAALGA